MEKKKKKENRRKNRWDKYFVGRREKREKWWAWLFCLQAHQNFFYLFCSCVFEKIVTLHQQAFFFGCCCCLFLFSSLPLFQFICFGFIYVSFFIISLCLFPYFIFIYDSTVVVFGFLLPFFFSLSQFFVFFFILFLSLFHSRFFFFKFFLYKFWILLACAFKIYIKKRRRSEVSTYKFFI